MNGTRGGWLTGAGAASWRLLGIGALLVATWWLAERLMPVLLPTAVALLLAALLRPVAARLERRGVPAALAALTALALLVGVVAVAAALIVPPFVTRIGALGDNLEQGVRQVVYSAAHDVARVTRPASDRAVDSAIASLRQHRAAVAGDVLTGATVAATAAAGAVLTLFLTFFLVKDGERMWAWVMDLLPRARRPAVDRWGRAAIALLGIYIRGICFVATVDAVFIGLALILVGVPLALPLIVLTWVAAFFPIVGATVAGVAAVLVALVSHGLGSALIVAAAVIAVQQLEGNVLYPVVIGPRMNLHPVAILIGVTLGGALAGVPGAFLAVPVTIVGSVALAGRAERESARTTVMMPTAAPQQGGRGPSRATALSARDGD